MSCCARLGRGGGRRRSRRGSTRLRRSSWRIRSRAITRTSGRPLVSLGVLGVSADATGPAGPAALLLAAVLALTYLTGHPQEWLLLVWPCRPGPLDGRGHLAAGDHAGRAERPRGSAACVLGSCRCRSGLAGAGRGARNCRPALAAPQSRSRCPDVGIPQRYHLDGLNAFQLLSPTALGGPADYFGDDNYWETVCSIGLVPLALAMVAALRHPDRRLVRGWLVLVGLAFWFACGRHLVLYHRSTLWCLG